MAAEEVERKRASNSSMAVKKKKAESAQRMREKDRPTITFEDEVIEGELVMPQATVTVSRDEPAPPEALEAHDQEAPEPDPEPLPDPLGDDDVDYLAEATGELADRDLFGEALGGREEHLSGNAVGSASGAAGMSIAGSGRGGGGVAFGSASVQASPARKVVRAGRARRGKGGASFSYEPDTIELFGPEPEVPEVTATALSIVVPELGGETVRYQTLLLPSGQALTLPIDAVYSPRRNR